MKKPEILNKKIVAKSRLFSIEDIHLKFSNGVETHFERLKPHSAGSVMILPLLDDNTMLLVREYGAGVDAYTLGFPKGAVDAGEDLIKTANRELMEEVGYGARDLSVLCEFSAIPGYVNSKMPVVLARDLYEQREEGDEPEPLEVVKWSLDNIDALLNHPEFYGARSVAALLTFERGLRK